MNKTQPLVRSLVSSLSSVPKTPRFLSCRKLVNTPTTSTIPTARFFTTTNAKMAANAQTLIDLAKQRRSHYPLSKDLTISKARVEEIVKELLDQIPSSFNSQSNRVVVLFGAEHEKLWDIAAEVLKPVVPADQWESTAGKMAMFKGAAGSVLFFEDQKVVNDMQEKFALYADRFPIWAGHSDAMLQFSVWTALEAEGLGANLQHYNPLIDNRVASEWKVPADWKLQAQLVFGGKTGEAGAKTYLPEGEKYKSFGA